MDAFAIFRRNYILGTHGVQVHGTCLSLIFLDGEIIVSFKKSVVGFALGSTAMFTAAPAHADWVEVQSTNFRYYTTDSAEDAKERVENLEKLDRIVREVTGNTQPPGDLRLTVFEVPTMRDVQETLPGSPRGVGAYYTTSDAGAHVVTFHRAVRAPSGGGRIQRTYRIQDEVTQHEYLHHLMFQYFPTNYPTFYPEGFAEYYGQIQFEDDNVIVVGHAPNGRLEQMRNWLHMRDVLTAKSYGDVSDVGALYAQGWLLTHMAAARPEVGLKLNAFLKAVTEGTSYEEAAEQAFGDLDAFDREVRAYKDQVTALTIKLDGVETGPVTVRELSDLEEKLVPIELKLRSTIKYSEFSGMASRVRSALQSDPNNAYGLGTLALVEWIAGNYDGAAQASAAALAADPNSARGNLVAGNLAVKALVDSGSTDPAAWAAARQPFRTAIDADPLATEAMVAYFRSYFDNGQLASAPAQNAMMRAFRLAPRNDNIRYMLAQDFENRDLIEEAIFMISPLAFGSLDGAENEDEKKRERDREQFREFAEEYFNVEYREPAKDMLERLEAKQAGTWNEGDGAVATEETTAG